jgi:hypothetical protein
MSTSHQQNRAQAAIRFAVQTRLLTDFIPLPAMGQIKGSEVTISNQQTLPI